MTVTRATAPRKPQSTSLSARIRRELAEGPMTTEETACIIGIKMKICSALMTAMERSGQLQRFGTRVINQREHAIYELTNRFAAAAHRDAKKHLALTRAK
jgi:hypothetical protein